MANRSTDIEIKKPPPKSKKIDGRKVAARKTRITKEKTRLSKIYANLNKDTRATAEGLIERAAYMRITLEDYEADIIANGAVELFSQSDKSDPYERERPVARLYSTMNKNYQSIMKMLNDLLPKVDPIINPEADDGFDEFTNKR